MRIAICWELGGNYGHITGLAPLAKALKAEGAEVVFILRDLRHAHLLGCDAICVQAPLPAVIPRSREFHSYADILASVGYDDVTVLAPYALAWRDLFSRHGINCVVAEHAPTALLAARLDKRPAVAIGSGFVLPPAGEHGFAPFVAEVPPSANAALVLSVINTFLSTQTSQPLMALGELFLSARAVLCCFPELDHYPARADTGDVELEYWGPLFSEDLGREMHWHESAGSRIFAYLTDKIRHLDEVVAAIAQLPGEKLVHVAGVDCSRWAGIGNGQIRFSAEPLRLDNLLTETDLVIGQGGLGLTSLASMRGCKQVIIPTQMEQRMLARRMFTQGLAYVVEPDATASEYAAVFTRALDCLQMWTRVKSFQDAYGGFEQSEQLAAMAAEILTLD